MNIRKQKWNYMDIHTHILPGIDDGACDMDETVEMIKQARQEGVGVIIATPHYGRRNPDYNKQHTLEVCGIVRQWMATAYPGMKLYMGNELYYSPGIIEDLKTGKAATIGGTAYCLVEFSENEESAQIVAAVRALTREGYRPILAHVERYQCLHKELEQIKVLIDLGAYMQVNARGFLGNRFDKRASWCRRLLQEELVHFVASDCHDAHARKPIMHSAVEAMIDFVGEDAVKQIVNANIIKLIRDEFI